MMARRLSPRRNAQKLQRLLRDWIQFGEKLPEDLNALFGQIREGKVDVRLEHQRLQPSVNRLVFGIVTSALFLGSIQLWSFNVPPTFEGVSIFGVIGCAISFFLAFRLLRSINKSGHLDSNE
jgi:ubiquinone biosynthesis protein